MLGSKSIKDIFKMMFNKTDVTDLYAVGEWVGDTVNGKIARVVMQYGDQLQVQLGDQLRVWEVSRITKFNNPNSYYVEIRRGNSITLGRLIRSVQSLDFNHFTNSYPLQYEVDEYNPRSDSFTRHYISEESVIAIAPPEAIVQAEVA